MGYRSTADDKLEECRGHLKDLVISLTDLVVHECQGVEEYKDEVRENWREALINLISIKL